MQSSSPGKTQAKPLLETVILGPDIFLEVFPNIVGPTWRSKLSYLRQIPILQFSCPQKSDVDLRFLPCLWQEEADTSTVEFHPPKLTWNPTVFSPWKRKRKEHTMNFSVPCQFSRVLLVFFPQRGSTGFSLESLNCDLYVPTVGIGKSTQFSRGSYTQYEDSLFKGGMTIPEIATFDPDTYGTSNLGRLWRCDFSDFMERHGVIQKKGRFVT